MYYTCRIITILFIILFIFSCKKTPTGSDPVVVTIPDANFEALIREVLDKPTGDILNTDLLTITTLIGDNREISNISGIEYCTNLDTLDLNENDIDDINLLSGLLNLEYLNFHKNQITDIKALVDNTGLNSGDEVWLGNNPLSDASLNTYIP